MAVGVLHVCDKFGVAGSSIHGVSRLFCVVVPPLRPGALHGEPRGPQGPRARVASGSWSRASRSHHLGRGRFDPRILTDLVAVARARAGPHPPRPRLRRRRLRPAGGARHGRARSSSTSTSPIRGCPATRRLADRLLRRPHRSRHRGQRLHPRLPRARAARAGGPRPRSSGTARPSTSSPRCRRERALRVRPSSASPTRRSWWEPSAASTPRRATRYLLEAAPAVLDGAPASPVPDRRATATSWSRCGSRRGPSASASACVFAGHRADVPDLLGAIDVLCIPSLYEGTPLALFEAMAAGKAIVSSAVDGCAEVLGRTGARAFSSRPATPAALARGPRSRSWTSERCRALPGRARAASRALRHRRLRRADAGPLRRGPRPSGGARAA